jgi:starvation-inducible DNA-binding protein
MQALVTNMNTTDRPQMMFHTSRIDIPEGTRRQVAERLNETLATTLDLKTQVKQAHWTVKGMDFFQLHELFDQMASQLEEYVDMVAERITALGGTPLGTARMAAQESILPEYPLDIINSKDHITALADRFAAYARSLREGADLAEELHDMDTNDLYVEVSRTIDKYLWFLEAHLQGNS